MKGARRSIRAHLIVGLTLMLVLAGGFGGWASTVPISGALIAPGPVVVDSNVKKVQHPTGGVVGEVRVRDGDTVKAGDIVVRLDETVVKASLAIVVKTLNGLLARAARLEAEQRGVDKIKFPAMLTDRADDPEVRDVMASETKLFEVRVNGRAGQKSQLRERVMQLNEEIAGPLGAGKRQGQGNRAGRKGTDRRPPALRPAPDPDLAPDHAGARLRPPVGRARAIHRLARAGQGQDHRNRTADHPGRQGHGQRGLQGSARDQ